MHFLFEECYLNKNIFDYWNFLYIDSLETNTIVF